MPFAAWVVALTASASCTIDFDQYDPRLGQGGSTSSSSSAGGGEVCAPGNEVPCYTGTPGTEGVGTCRSGIALCGEDGTLGACEGEIIDVPEVCATADDENCDGSINDGCDCEPGNLYGCYDGDPATIGQGPCQSGVRTCNEDGHSYGQCLGQVVPLAEDCASPTDDDCNGEVNDACAVWARMFGATDNDYGRAIAAASDGSLVIAGEIRMTVDFDGTMLASAGDADVFVAALESDGDVTWAKRFGNSAAQAAQAIALDGSGNVFVTGGFDGVLDFGNGTLPLSSATATTNDVFVAKLDDSGVAQWAIRLGGAGEDLGLGIVATDAGEAVVAGEFFGAVDFGDGAEGDPSSVNGFVMALDATGAITWHKTFGTTSDDSGVALALTPDDSVVLAGEFAAEVTFGTTTLDDVGGLDSFAVALDLADGAPLWVTQIGGTGDEHAHDVAVDDAGNVYVAGRFSQSIELASTVMSQGGDDAFLAVLDDAGVVADGLTWGDPNDQLVQSVRVDSSGVWLALGHLGTVDYGGGALIGAEPSNQDIVLVHLSRGLTHLSSRRFGNVSDQDPRGLALVPDGAAVVGECGGTLNFGSGDVSSAGAEDICLAVIAP